MKKIILIENADVIRYEIISRLAEKLYSPKKDDNIPEYTWRRKMREKLEADGFIFEEFQENNKVREKYPDGLPKETVIVLDGDLDDGNTDKIFDLFDKKAKSLTVVNSGNDLFLAIAKDNGFPHTILKSDRTVKRLIEKMTQLLQLN